MKELKEMEKGEKLQMFNGKGKKIEVTVIEKTIFDDGSIYIVTQEKEV